MITQVVTRRGIRHHVSAAVIALLAVLVVLVGPLAGCGASTSAGKAGVDPDSGLPYIAQDQLPPQARQTLKLIDKGGPYPYSKDGVVFHNREGVLPHESDGYYHEFTVPTPGADTRGARRIVTGDHNTIFYYTDDHYDSFSRIRR
jgi:ribonuclease T1